MLPLRHLPVQPLKRVLPGSLEAQHTHVDTVGTVFWLLNHRFLQGCSRLTIGSHIFEVIIYLFVYYYYHYYLLLLLFVYLFICYWSNIPLSHVGIFLG